MDSESLRIFCAVASELSITHAANRLGRAPSNVTTRIQQLEADLGAELFVRIGKRLSLSATGQDFLDYAKRMMALEEEARHVVSGGVNGGTLRIGSMESTAASRLPSVLAGYHAGFPETRLELTTGPSRPLLENVRAGQLDCAFIALPPSFENASTLADLGLAYRTLWREELQLLLPAHESGCDRVADIQTRSLVAFPQGCTYRSMAENLLGIGGSTTWRVQEMASYHAMTACVAAGASVALLPESVLTLTRSPSDCRVLPAGQADTLMVWRGGYNVPAFQHLLQQLDSVR